MTPMQVILLGHKMRQAQKAVKASLSGEGSLGPRYMAMADLEDQFDAAIIPYVDHAQYLKDADHEV